MTRVISRKPLVETCDNVGIGEVRAEHPIECRRGSTADSDAARPADLREVHAIGIAREALEYFRSTDEESVCTELGLSELKMRCASDGAMRVAARCVGNARRPGRSPVSLTPQQGSSVMRGLSETIGHLRRVVNYILVRSKY